ncbi:sll0787 family AIR synthase-like protein [Curvibacter sp. HBC28]|uniref:Sll0787 family AIR synthase-like protein n=1 Tax=Curvibacter microcysteis TaxID=3026419 RepID=A0ABT5MCK0_9BURK|nr:sll0787 family AIR synthase-like protein [Curvibacter sp. HBC28]MDD0814308.1 sll0787 family AIR synthase-like protein [Curvibacter sp. HBC28]
MSELMALVTALRDSRGFAHKRDISDVVNCFDDLFPQGVTQMDQAVPLGDDAAALPDGHGAYQLLAIEGLVEDFITRMPWFAGYSSVMVNISDIYAMGGRPTAVVNALWGQGAGAETQKMLAGMAAASQRYGVPMVGGHSNLRSEHPQLAVSILGQAKRLLSSFKARAGDRLLMAVDLRGQWQEPFPYWNASTEAPAERLRADLELLPEIAEAGLCEAAKDISMAGTLGTTLMLLECSGVGAVVDLDAVPKPEGVPLLRWLTAFPSYGFILSVRPEHVNAVQRRFEARGLACADVGEVKAVRQLIVQQGHEWALLWNLATQAFIQGSRGRGLEVGSPA